MKSDQLLSELFTQNELKNLAKIVDFFEEQIYEKTNESHLEKRYDLFLKKDSIKLYNTRNSYSFDYNKQKKLYFSLDTTFFNNFFDISQGFYDRNKISYKFFSPKSYDKYGVFLKKCSERNLILKDYYIDTVIINDFLSINAAADLSFNYKRFNFKDVKMRMIYSIHFLSLNEYYYKKLKFNT